MLFQGYFCQLIFFPWVGQLYFRFICILYDFFVKNWTFDNIYCAPLDTTSALIITLHGSCFHRSQRSVGGDTTIFISLFWVYLLSWVYTWLSKLPDIQGCFRMPSFLRPSLLGFRRLTVLLSDVPSAWGSSVHVSMFWAQQFPPSNSELGNTETNTLIQFFFQPHTGKNKVISE